MSPTVLILGASGQLGRTFLGEARARGLATVGTAGSNPIPGLERLDITNTDALLHLLERTAPDLIINCAAIVSLDLCEKNPGLAYAVNARAVAVLAEACHNSRRRLVHISTDHFFTGDGDMPHHEDAPVRLVNEYARTKYAGECFALTAPKGLAIRTNITGFRGDPSTPTFAEWLIRTLVRRDPLTLFTDFHTSTLDCETCAQAVLDLALDGRTGLYNVASRDCVSKQVFAQMLAQALGIDLDWAGEGSVRSLPIPRAESLGLNVAKAEAALGRRLATARQAAANLASQYQAQAKDIP